MRQAMLLVVAGVLASAAAAEDVRLCGGRFSPASTDGRLLNHFRYSVASRAELVRPPLTLPGQCAAIHRDMRADFEALLASARSDPVVGQALVAVSCFRSRQHQARIFCRDGRSTVPLVRSYQVAPPGFSEHATGMAIDFGDRRGRCRLVACFARTAAGRWLAKNAPAFGFELSFPKDNAQGVAFEPWHWRWVGRDDSGRARRAQAIFAAARARLPQRLDEARPSPFAGSVSSQVADATAALARQIPARPAQPMTLAAGPVETVTIEKENQP